MPERARCAIDGFEDALSRGTMLFQEVTELADRRLVRDALAAKIDADERPHRAAVVRAPLPHQDRSN